MLFTQTWFLHWTHFTHLNNSCALFMQQQLLTSVLAEMENTAQSKNNFVEVHLNGL